EHEPGAPRVKDVWSVHGRDHERNGEKRANADHRQHVRRGGLREADLAIQRGPYVRGHRERLSRPGTAKIATIQTRIPDVSRVLRIASERHLIAIRTFLPV